MYCSHHFRTLPTSVGVFHLLTGARVHHRSSEGTNAGHHRQEVVPEPADSEAERDLHQDPARETDLTRGFPQHSKDARAAETAGFHQVPVPETKVPGCSGSDDGGGRGPPDADDPEGWRSLQGDPCHQGRGVQWVHRKSVRARERRGHRSRKRRKRLDRSERPTSIRRNIQSLRPVNGKISGNAAKAEMMKSKLTNAVLGKVWNLADVDNDGMLDIDEFGLALHLIDVKIAGHELPNELPKHLIPPSKRHTIDD